MKTSILIVLANIICIISSASSIYTGDSLYKKMKYTDAYTYYQKSLLNNEYSEQMLIKMAYISEGLEKPAETLYYLSLVQEISPSENVLYQIENIANENGLEGYTTTDQQLIYILQHQYASTIKWGLTSITIALLLLLLWKKIKQKKVSVGTAFLMVFFGTAACAMNNSNWKTQIGIVNQANTILYTGPSPASKIDIHIPYGSKIQVLEKTDVWYKISYEEKEGFVKQTKLLTLL